MKMWGKSDNDLYNFRTEYGGKNSPFVHNKEENKFVYRKQVCLCV